MPYEPKLIIEEDSNLNDDGYLFDDYNNLAFLETYERDDLASEEEQVNNELTVSQRLMQQEGGLVDTPNIWNETNTDLLDVEDDTVSLEELDSVCSECSGCPSCSDCIEEKFETNRVSLRDLIYTKTLNNNLS